MKWSLENAFYRILFYKDIIFSVADEIPLTKPSLKECIKKSKCQRFRPETKTHVYINTHNDFLL